MTLFFGDLHSNDTIKTMREIIALIPPSEKLLIEKIFAAKNRLRHAYNDISQFGNPEDFQNMFERLKEFAAELMPKTQLWLQKEHWEKTSPITRSIAIQAMKEQVDFYDLAIKKLIASQEFKNESEKVIMFKEMIGPFIQLMRGWGEETIGENDNFSNEKRNHIKLYLEPIEKAYNSITDVDPIQLEPAPDFEVASRVIGTDPNGFKFLKKFDRLGSIFTLVHQNLMILISILTKELITLDKIQKCPLPQSLKSALITSHHISVSLKDMIVHSQLIGVNVVKTGIKFFYNMPLFSAHSTKFDIEYDRHSKDIMMAVQYFGENTDDNRWNRGSEEMSILSKIRVLPLKGKPVVSSHEFTYICYITEQNAQNIAFQEYNDFLSSTMAVKNVEPLTMKLNRLGLLSEAALYIAKHGGWRESVVEYTTLYEYLKMDLIHQKTEDLQAISTTLNLEKHKKLHEPSDYTIGYTFEYTELLARYTILLTKLVSRGYEIEHAKQFANDLTQNLIKHKIEHQEEMSDIVIELLKQLIKYPQGIDAAHQLINQRSNYWTYLIPSYEHYVVLIEKIEKLLAE
jgi:hypothetical protein